MLRQTSEPLLDRESPDLTLHCGLRAGKRRHLGPCVPGEPPGGEGAPQSSGEWLSGSLCPETRRLASKCRAPGSLPLSRAACHRLCLPQRTRLQRKESRGPLRGCQRRRISAERTSLHQEDGWRPPGTPKGTAHRTGDERGKTRSPRPAGPRPTRQLDPSIY